MGMGEQPIQLERSTRCSLWLCKQRTGVQQTLHRPCLVLNQKPSTHHPSNINNIKNQEISSRTIIHVPLMPFPDEHGGRPPPTDKGTDGVIQEPIMIMFSIFPCGSRFGPNVLSVRSRSSGSGQSSYQKSGDFISTPHTQCSTRLTNISFDFYSTRL
ncbi:hypothetical protein B0F90DRAFT_1719459 [Multifurca ochricompacta]|uniref:Uncharacterized protein n=1 Tax=Multifurca ochricompacta TaxID=376703 RepID=A0AAD4QMC2_9AGAM|nr:hypothetical protein B0F90DRAFT_1719459 [Multifurca ochricompacta]